MNGTIDINTIFGPMPSSATDLSVDELVSLMERHSVAASCTLSTVGLLLDHNSGNAATRAACAENRKLVATATINPLSFFGGDGSHLKFKSDGFRMVRFFPSAQGWDAEHAAFSAALKSLAEQALPIMVQIDASGDVTRAVRAASGYPGGIILAGISDRTLSEAVALMQTNPKLYLESSNLLATGALKHVVDCVGADRVLYGSGAPERPMASGLGVLKNSGLSEAQQSQIQGANASGLLGL
jgi:predicted TIM-barrel fold metal-dependent hydrolase